MPVYQFALQNGKTLRLEGDSQPSDAEVEQAAASAGVALAAQKPADRGILGDLGAAAQWLGAHPKITAGAGAMIAAPLAAPFAASIPLTAATGMLRTAGAGAVPGAAIGGAQGLITGGPMGAIKGALRGGVTGASAALGARGAAGMLRTGGAMVQGAGAGSAAEAIRQFGNRQVLTPEEQAVKDALMARATREASEAGTVNAGTQAREPNFLEQLFGR